LRLIGIHVHLGSQITDATVYRRAADEMVAFACDLRSRGFPIEEVGLGGGWAVAYRPGDAALDAQAVATTVAQAFASQASMRVAIEPGRSLVARAGLAIYRVGSVKRRNGFRIVGVDGGMGDNPRPALYGSQYTVLPERGLQKPVGNADIVGRYCEAGDVLARSIPMPEVSPGEILCVPVSGAYQLSMASTYNLVPQPAVVMVSRGSARLLVRRATLSDMFARDVPETT
jgi:diaminopimelate decarboxylase